jgi:hypothetical protein
LVPNNPNFNVVGSCSPDGRTQAMFVSRYGYNNVDRGQLRQYLNNGGIVITEFRTSHRIFSKAFTSVNRGSKEGDCQDRIPGGHQYNSNDPFWQAPNNDFNRLPSNGTGCGYDVSNYPGITPLVGWDSNTVAVAYRNKGRGRLWLVDVDWQDDSYGYDESQDLLQYMALHRR